MLGELSYYDDLLRRPDGGLGILMVVWGFHVLFPLRVLDELRPHTLKVPFWIKV